MKKFLTLALALVMTLAMSVPAFAVELVTEDGGSVNIDVSGAYVGADASADVIAVDITWDSMDFTYMAEGSKIWDATNMWHTTVSSEDAGWVDETKNIAISNRSNVDIKAEATFSAIVDGFSLNISEAVVLSEAEKGTAPNDTNATGTPGTPTTGNITVSVAENATAISSDNTDLGDITVTITKTAHTEFVPVD